MHLQIGRSTSIGAHRQRSKQYLAAVCGAALTVAALSSIGAWQATSHGRTGRAATASVPVTSSTGTRATLRPQPFTYYMVA